MTNTQPNYPLIESDPDGIKAASGRPLSHITLDADSDQALTIDDLTIHAETLRKQAQIALGAGHTQLAANLRRAAELEREHDHRVGECGTERAVGVCARDDPDLGQGSVDLVLPLADIPTAILSGVRSTNRKPSGKETV